MSKKDFFIGWAEMPDADRRFFLKAGAGLVIGAAGVAGFVAASQRPVGRGTWDIATFKDFTGVVTASPYPMLRTRDIDGQVRTAMLVCQTKCGVDLRLQNMAGKAVVINGSLIQRGDFASIAVADGPEWIHAADAPVDPALAFPAPEPLGEITLAGEILDTKCWFGAMRPGEGKVHKACASLCIRSGVPPAFFARDARDNAALLVMTENGGRFGETLLAHVADPVEVTGTVSRAGNVFLLDVSADSVRRV
ncbi:MAG: hypothetical protein AAFY69_15080 [Pseudomonadota bacterium]